VVCPNRKEGRGIRLLDSLLNTMHWAPVLQTLVKRVFLERFRADAVFLNVTRCVLLCRGSVMHHGTVGNAVFTMSYCAVELS